jgi:hypothetical protein
MAQSVVTKTAEDDNDKWQKKVHCSRHYNKKFSTIEYFKITNCIFGTTWIKTNLIQFLI